MIEPNRRQRARNMRCGCHSHNGFLTGRGYAEAAQRSLEGLEVADVGLTRDAKCVRLDKSGSVSALIEVEDLYAHVTDQLILEQSERFRNGS